MTIPSMPTSAVLGTAVRQILGAMAPRYLTRGAANDAFEAYIFALVVRAASDMGATVRFLDVNGNVPSTLIFRTSPGVIYSTARAYCHAELAIPNSPLVEVHLGVKVQGTSGVKHECDVLVILKSEADLARQKNVTPRGSKALIIVECKYYAAGLGIALARGFQGLHTDVHVRAPFFISNIGSRSVERFLSHFGKRWQHNVLPHSSSADDFMSKIREQFEYFKSRNS